MLFPTPTADIVSEPISLPDEFTEHTEGIQVNSKRTTQMWIISSLWEVGRENQGPGNRLANQKLNLPYPQALLLCWGLGVKLSEACIRTWVSSPSPKANERAQVALPRPWEAAWTTQVPLRSRVLTGAEAAILNSECTHLIHFSLECGEVLTEKAYCPPEVLLKGASNQAPKTPMENADPKRGQTPGLRFLTSWKPSGESHNQTQHKGIVTNDQPARVWT